MAAPRKTTHKIKRAEYQKVYSPEWYEIAEVARSAPLSPKKRNLSLNKNPTDKKLDQEDDHSVEQIALIEDIKNALRHNKKPEKQFREILSAIESLDRKKYRLDNWLSGLSFEEAWLLDDPPAFNGVEISGYIDAYAVPAFCTLLRQIVQSCAGIKTSKRSPKSLDRLRGLQKGLEKIKADISRIEREDGGAPISCLSGLKAQLNQAAEEINKELKAKHLSRGKPITARGRARIDFYAIAKAIGLNKNNIAEHFTRLSVLEGEKGVVLANERAEFSRRCKKV